MSSLNVSVVLDCVEQLSPTLEGLHVHGASLGVAKTFSYLLGFHWIGTLEVFLPPDEYQRTEVLSKVAAKILPAWRIGRGSLRFFPIYALEDVWRDGAERVLICVDPQHMARDRYLRDRFAKGPTILSCQTHGLGSHDLYASLARVAAAPPVRFDAIVCLSEACKRSLELSCQFQFGLDQPFCSLPVISNPLDVERLRPYSEEEKKNARRLLELPEDATIALCLARLTPNSKADLLPLIDAFGDVAGPNDLLLCVGPENVANYAKRLLDHSLNRKLENRFAVRTMLDHWLTPMMYGAADLYVLPSDNAQETLCTTVLEAMSAGLPVLASDWDGIRDSVVHEETGLLIPTYMLPGLQSIEDFSPAANYMTSLLMLAQNTIVDPKLTRNYLARLLSSKSERERLGRSGRIRAVERNTPQETYGHHRVVWEELLEMARVETAEQAAVRRSSASAVGIPVPYRAIYAEYGSRSVSPEASYLMLTSHGKKAAEGEMKASFYDETVPLLRPELFKHLTTVLGKSEEPQLMATVAAEGAAGTKLSVDQALFHLGLMIKRGLVDLSFAKVNQDH